MVRRTCKSWTATEVIPVLKNGMRPVHPGEVLREDQEDCDRGADSDQVFVERGCVGNRRDEPDVRQQDSEKQRDDRATEPAARREPSQPIRDRRHGAENGQQIDRVGYRQLFRYARSKRSRFITLFQAATKSCANFCLLSSQA